MHAVWKPDFQGDVFMHIEAAEYVSCPFQTKCGSCVLRWLQVECSLSLYTRCTWKVTKYKLLLYNKLMPMNWRSWQQTSHISHNPLISTILRSEEEALKANNAFVQFWTLSSLLIAGEFEQKCCIEASGFKAKLCINYSEWKLIQKLCQFIDYIIEERVRCR